MHDLDVHVVLFREITEKQRGNRHSTAKIGIVQHCAAISAIAELLVQYAMMSMAVARRPDYQTNDWLVIDIVVVVVVVDMTMMMVVMMMMMMMLYL